MKASVRLSRFLVVEFAVLCLSLAFATSASAAWRMEIESKTVTANQTGVTLNITFAWDVAIVQATLPLRVRSIDPGAFWTGVLPHYFFSDDLGDYDTVGVTFNSLVNTWATLIKEMRPGRTLSDPTVDCNTDADTNHFNGVSPDYFVINTQSSGNSLAAKPSGIVFVTLSFDVNGTAGNFEFDTACYSQSLSKIFMMDNNYQDYGPPPGSNVVVFTKGVVTITGSGILSEESDVPASYSLSQNYPNPFNANTVISFSLRETGAAKLEIYNILGQKVAVPIDGVLSAGVYSANWNGKDESGRTVPSGMYFYRLTAGEFTQIKKMVLMK